MKLSTFASEVSISTLLCCGGAAILLSACGGSASDGDAGKQNQFASHIEASEEEADSPAIDREQEESLESVVDEVGATDVAAALLEPGRVPLPLHAPQAAASAKGDDDVDRPEKGNHLWVSSRSVEGADGTKEKPYRTITQAAGKAKPGDTVHVLPGVYRENVRTKRSGKPGERILFVSEGKGNAKIIGSTSEATWDNRGSYVDIVGFDVSGYGRLGILNLGSYARMVGNYVHHMKVLKKVTDKNTGETKEIYNCSGSGGAGIDNGNYDAVGSEVIGNIVHDIGIPDGSCGGVHGIYHAQTGGRVSNNIVYRSAGWGLHLWHVAKDVVVSNNTVYENGKGGIVAGVGDSPNGREGKMTNVTIANNIVYNEKRPIETYCYANHDCIGGNNTFANNLVYKSGSRKNGRNGVKVSSNARVEGTIGEDPQFMDFPAKNLRLMRASPAVDAGLKEYAPVTDFDGMPRGDGIDIGAFESH